MKEVNNINSTDVEFRKATLEVEVSKKIVG